MKAECPPALPIGATLDRWPAIKLAPANSDHLAGFDIPLTLTLDPVVAPALPTYHLAQLMLGIFSYNQPGSAAAHWEALAGFTLLMLGIAWLVFQRAEQRS